MSRVLDLLQQGKEETGALDRLAQEVYPELRRLAGRYLLSERRGHTLQPTALVHEAYLRLVGEKGVDWQGRTHFLAVAARTMRRVLVEHARARGRQKRGGHWQRLSLDEGLLAAPFQEVDLLALHQALEKLEQLDSRQAAVVELRFFAGLTVEEVASYLGLSKRSVEGEWTHARAWLRRELSRS